MCTSHSWLFWFPCHIFENIPLKVALWVWPVREKATSEVFISLNGKIKVPLGSPVPLLTSRWYWKFLLDHIQGLRKKCCPGWSSEYSATFMHKRLGYKHFPSRKYYRTFTRERKLCKLLLQSAVPFFSIIWGLTFVIQTATLERQDKAGTFEAGKRSCTKLCTTSWQSQWVWQQRKLGS